MKKIKNLVVWNFTPHTLSLVVGDGLNNIVKIESDGVVRVKENREVIREIEGIKVLKKEFSDIPQTDIAELKRVLNDDFSIAIVSLLTARVLKGDKRLSDKEKSKIYIIANTIRDNQGKIIGADAIAPIEYV